jgi:hypothetical protein
MDDPNSGQPNKISWLDKQLLKFCPQLAARRLAKKLEIKNVVFDKLHETLHQVERIDFFPYLGNERGFILVLDLQTALFFNQDGDHFEYDGWEMGKYNKGPVTVLDGLAKKDLSPYPD